MSPFQALVQERTEQLIKAVAEYAVRREILGEADAENPVPGVDLTPLLGAAKCSRELVLREEADSLAAELRGGDLQEAIIEAARRQIIAAAYKEARAIHRRA